jgi:KDO2-lipid IV(A) lauroyltransferase
MPKPRSRLADYAAYLAVRVLVCLIQSLSPAAGRRLALGLAWLAYRLDRRHRLVACDNLRQAFPERFAAADPDPQVRAVYRHFCQLLIDIIHLPRKVHLTNWYRYVDLPDLRVLESLLWGRPLMFVTGHFGNWELGGYILGRLGFTAHAVARPLDNPYIDDYLRRFREGTGGKILAKKGDFKEMQELLARGGVLATLADQDAGARGLFVDFFGRPASTHKVMALLSLEYGVPLLVIGVRKVGEPLRYQIDLADVILPEDYRGRADAAKDITQRLTAALERIVSSAPEQYFWLHRRWKHQPPPKKGKKDKPVAA